MKQLKNQYSKSFPLISLYPLILWLCICRFFFYLKKSCYSEVLYRVMRILVAFSRPCYSETVLSECRIKRGLPIILIFKELSHWANRLGCLIFFFILWLKIFYFENSKWRIKSKWQFSWHSLTTIWERERLRTEFVPK
jgi:hypothetical protein